MDWLVVIKVPCEDLMESLVVKAGVDDLFGNDRNRTYES